MSGALCASFAFRRGQDVAWDQLNYHYYSAYAFVRGRIDIDAAPAQMLHSYYNPLPFLPFYFLFHDGGARVANIGLALIQGLNFALVAPIAAGVCQGAGWRRWACMAAALAISAASPWALSELGTSFTDIMASLPVMLGLALLVHTPSPGLRRLGLCGGLVGCGVGLKLTAGVFAPALLAACLLYGPRTVDRMRAASAAAAGIAGGFLLADGAWAYGLWRRFGNPVFPLFNGIFRSPDYAPRSFGDPVCLPHGVLDGLARPFTWALASKPVCDQADVRFALILVLLGVCAIPAAMRRRRPVTQTAGARLMMVFAVSLLCWLFVFSIPRYAVVQELLCGPVAVVAAGWCAAAWRLPGWAQPAAGGLVALASVSTLVAPSLGRVAFLPGAYGLQVPAALRDDGIFLVTGGPVTYLIPSLGKHARFFGITDWEDTNAGAGTVISNRILNGVRNAGSRKLRVIANLPLSLRTRQDLASFGLGLTGRCVAIPGFSFTGLTMICDLVRTSRAGPSALVLEPGVTWRFSEASSFPALTGPTGLDWTFPGPVADLRAGRAPGLLFRLPDNFAPGTPLEIDIRYRPLPADQADPARLLVEVNRTPAANRVARPEATDGTMVWHGCVPAPSIQADRLLAIDLKADAKRAVQLLSFAATWPAATDCLIASTKPPPKP